METGAAFLAQSREYLTAHYLPKLTEAIERLSEADLWWRPNDASNSIGNLMLHLAGNIRQWIVSGVGGAPDRRDRASEFSRREPPPRDELLAILTEAVLEADAVIARTDPAGLNDRRPVQGRSVTALQAIYHAVEHFGMHTGQIVYIAKLRSGADLGFYAMEAGIPRPAWPGHPVSGSRSSVVGHRLSVIALIPAPCSQLPAPCPPALRRRPFRLPPRRAQARHQSGVQLDPVPQAPDPQVLVLGVLGVVVVGDRRPHDRHAKRLVEDVLAETAADGRHRDDRLAERLLRGGQHGARDRQIERGG